MGKLSRRKGADGERHVAAMFNEHGIQAVRTAPMQAGHPSQLPDVDVRGFWVEVKRSKQPNIRAAFEQANTARTEHYLTTDSGWRVPVAITKADRSDWLVTVRFDDALRLGLFDKARKRKEE